MARDERTPGGAEDHDQEFIGEHLAEGRVFRRYGLADKAREQFEIVLRRFPDNVEALHELLDLYRPAGEREALAQERRAIAEVERLAREGSLCDRLVGGAATAGSFRCFTTSAGSSPGGRSFS